MESAIKGGEGEFVVGVDKEVVYVVGRGEVVESREELEEGGAVGSIGSGEVGDSVVDGDGCKGYE